MDTGACASKTRDSVRPTSVATTDEELMARVMDGDRDAYAMLVNRHLDAIHAFAYRLTLNAEDAADLAQETFLRVWHRASRWRPGRVKFTTWLHRITRNLSIDAHRRRTARGQTANVDVETLPSQATADSAPANSELHKALTRALSELPERQRTALLLCHRQGMSNRDAATVLGVSVDALESLLARGRRTLRKELRDYREAS